MSRMRISEVIGQRAGQVVTIASTATIAELLQLLREHSIGCVVVSDDGKHVDGIVSERDIVGRLAEGAIDSPNDVTVSAIMTTTVHTCGTGDDLETLARLMTERRIRHVPVLADGEMKGIVSIGDIVKARLDQLERERDHLVNYVHS